MVERFASKPLHAVIKGLMKIDALLSKLIATLRVSVSKNCKKFNRRLKKNKTKQKQDMRSVSRSRIVIFLFTMLSSTDEVNIESSGKLVSK